ncbi:MAG: T4 RnlA family RNA ligase [Crocosphaera sp.]|nr:T4 RnlA family RNA ligase [Crocosphaera sp.]
MFNNLQLLTRQVPYDQLIYHLQIEKDNNNIYEHRLEDLTLYCYTKHCVYNAKWNEWNTQARGLILDTKNQRIVATPFPKFFNYGERQITLPSEPFKVFDKLDGSLIICYYYQDQWRTSTKGDLQSLQAQKAQIVLNQLPVKYLEEGTTYLFEYISPDNKIIINYSEEQLILLGAYTEKGIELTFSEIECVASQIGVLVPQKSPYSNIEKILEVSKSLDSNHEGFVIKFENGLRLKFKGSEYCRIQKLLNGITPLGIWELMKEQANLALIRQEIPEEYWTDFDTIEQQLTQQLNDLIDEVETYHLNYQHFSDKELGLKLNSLPTIPKAYLFQRRKKGKDWYNNPKSRTFLFNHFRPKDNQLT